MLFVILGVATVKMLTKHFFRELVILNGCEGSLYSHCLRSLVATLCRDESLRQKMQANIYIIAINKQNI